MRICRGIRVLTKKRENVAVAGESRGTPAGATLSGGPLLPGSEGYEEESGRSAPGIHAWGHSGCFQQFRRHVIPFTSQVYSKFR